RSEGRQGQSPKRPRRVNGATYDRTLAATGRRGGVRAGLGASRRRALRAEQECNAGNENARTLTGFARSWQCALP
ncbi:hypothetical protein ABTE83_19590, partial [Acinetobacter baumannii]